MILPLVIFANLAQQDPPPVIPQMSDRFVLVRKPGPTPVSVVQAYQREGVRRIGDMFSPQDYDFVPLEGANVTVVIEKSAVPFGALNDALKLLTVIAKSPDLTATGREVPDSIAEVIFARSFADLSRVTPEFRKQFVVGARLQYEIELISSEKKFSFKYGTSGAKAANDRVKQMVWPNLPESVLRGEEPSAQERPGRPKAKDKELTIEYSFAARPLDMQFMRMVNDAIDKYGRAIEKQIAEKTGEIESKAAAMGIIKGALKEGGTRSELPQEVLASGRRFASSNNQRKQVDEIAVDIFFSSFDRFKTTKTVRLMAPARQFPGNESLVMDFELLP